MGDRTWDLAHRRPRTNQLWLCSHTYVSGRINLRVFRWSVHTRPPVNRVSGPIQFQLVRVRVALNFNHIFESYLAFKIVIRPWSINPKVHILSSKQTNLLRIFCSNEHSANIIFHFYHRRLHNVTRLVRFHRKMCSDRRIAPMLSFSLHPGLSCSKAD